MFLADSDNLPLNLASPTSQKKVLLLHCKYLQKGGEDKVVTEEGALLETHYQVVRFIRSNQELLGFSQWQQLQKMIWNRGICRDLQDMLAQHEPDIVHVHNTFPLFSPAVFHTLGRWKRQCQKQGRQVKIVMTLHNFRLHCPQASLMRPLKIEHGQVQFSAFCQHCFTAGHFASAIRSRCYRGSLVKTLAISWMLTLHKKLKTWHRNVDKFIYLNTAQKSLLTKVGFPQNKFIYKPNFISGNWVYSQPRKLNSCLRLLFVGRLSEEKGLLVLLDAMLYLRESLDSCDMEYKALERNIELRIAGDGPLRKTLQDFIYTYNREKILAGIRLSMEYLGGLEPSTIYEAMAESHFIVLPSIWYEGMPITLLESLAVGRPVIGFRLGACREVLSHQGNGILVPFFSNLSAEQDMNLEAIHSHKELVENLSSAIKEARIITQEQYSQMCVAARLCFENKYTAEQNLCVLQDIYES